MIVGYDIIFGGCLPVIDAPACKSIWNLKQINPIRWTKQKGMERTVAFYLNEFYTKEQIIELIYKCATETPLMGSASGSLLVTIVDNNYDTDFPIGITYTHEMEDPNSYKQLPPDKKWAGLPIEIK